MMKFIKSIGSAFLSGVALAIAPTADAAWGDWKTWGDQGDGTYRNPVLPADFSDLDSIRVGPDYYAISSTFQYSPGVVILHSKDLVNWTYCGHAVPDVTQISPAMNWDRMDRFGTGIWAGAIRYHAGKFWIYFGTPNEGYFSEVRGEGRVPMMGRSQNITGPYEYRQIAHVKRGVDMEPNQGGLVQSEAGDWWFFTHHGSGDWSGRIASLLPVSWTNGWPIIGEPGADGIGNMVWSADKPVKGTKRLTPQTDDEFSTATLAPQWEWHYQPRAGKWSLTERPGFLRLHAFKGFHGDNLLKIGNVLTQRPLRTSTNIVTVKLEVGGMADGQSAGLVQLQQHRRLGLCRCGLVSL